MTDTQRPEVGYLLFLGAAGLAVVGNLVTIATFPSLSAQGTVLWLAGPLAVVVASVAVFRQFRTAGLPPEDFFHVGIWMVSCGLLFGAAGLLWSYFQFVEGMTSRFLLQPFVGWSSAGVFAGSLIGYYDAVRRRRTRELDRARREADQLAEQLTVLNRVLRHDIRNKINVVQGSLDEVARRSNGHAEDVELARKQADRIVELADNARRAEELLAAEGTDTAEYDLVSVLGAVARELRGEYPDAHVHTDLPERAPVRANALVESALRNVVENAIEHNDREYPEVTVTLTVDDDRVEVIVRDDGPGIPEREVEVLRTGRESAVRHSRGMGLWITNWVVEHAGGDVAFERARPRGSVVRISLPAAS